MTFVRLLYWWILFNYCISLQLKRTFHLYFPHTHTHTQPADWHVRSHLTVSLTSASNTECVSIARHRRTAWCRRQSALPGCVRVCVCVRQKVCVWEQEEVHLSITSRGEQSDTLPSGFISAMCQSRPGITLIVCQRPSERPRARVCACATADACECENPRLKWECSALRAIRREGGREPGWGRDGKDEGERKKKY